MELFVPPNEHLESLLSACKDASQLQELYCYGNSLLKSSTLPRLSHLRNLTSLYLWDNNLALFPHDACLLTGLTALDLSGNDFHRVPKEIRSLEHLEVLYLSNNRNLNVIPTLCPMKSLRRLYLEKTSIGEDLAVNAASMATCQRLTAKIRNEFRNREICLEAVFAFLCIHRFRHAGVLQTLNSSTWRDVAQFLFASRNESIWNDGRE